MDKPKAFLRIDESEYTHRMILYVGRVAIPLVFFHTVLVAILLFSLLFPLIFGAFTKTVPDPSLLVLGITVVAATYFLGFIIYFSGRIVDIFRDENRREV